MSREPRWRLEAVCFDLDGVLIDSEHAWDAARRAVVAENGGRWLPEATRAMMGMSSSEWSRYLADALEVPLPPAEINDRVLAKLLNGYAHHVPLLPGATAAVRRLARRWPLALASSSNRQGIDFVLGLRSASGAGMLVVAIPNREFPPDAEALGRADLIPHNLDELTEEALLTVASRPARAQA